MNIEEINPNGKDPSFEELIQLFEKNGLTKQAEQVKSQMGERKKLHMITPLKINKKLPQIVIPPDKLQMFIDWWDTDIRFEHSCPHAFDEGYLTYSLPTADLTTQTAKDGIKFLAKTSHKTYREVETRMKELNTNKTIIHFIFQDNDLFFERYEDDVMVAKGHAKIGNNEEPDPSTSEILGDYNSLMVLLDKMCGSKGKAANAINLFSINMVITAMWYIATAKSTKYVYEQHIPVVTSRHKKVVQVKPIKTISVPIYDMGKIRVVKTENLVARKRGWTYSHAFQVHGHYRHYKNGKVIFINSFVKGKDKELKAQTINLQPK